MRRREFLKRTTVATAALGFLPTIVSASERDASSGQCLKSWTLATEDTRLTVGATDKGQLCLYDLSNPAVGWNWTAQPSVLPLINKVTVNGAAQDLQWKFQVGVVNNTNGQKVTLRFVCAQPALQLDSIWHARPGRGPVCHIMFIKNNSSGVVTIGEQETFDVHVVGSKTNASVWYISDDRAVPDPTGVYCDPLTSGYQKTLPVTSLGSDWIPYVVVSDSEGGVYLGWEWSNGRMEVSADPTSRGARLKMGNGDNFRTDLAAGETFEVPPGFIGVYAGDLDDAGNSLRQYLFNYNLPEMLKTNMGYPKVEWNAFAATGKGQGSWDPTEKKYYPFIDDIAPLGFEEVVIDIGWWSSYGKPDPGHIVTDAKDWPSGMAAAAKYAHDRGLRFGLYDNQTEDLTSESGKQEFINDITYLLNDLHADFYRSDCTAGPTIQGKFGVGQRAHYPEDVLYWATKGFYETLDTLYAEFPDFSWENCQCGGAMKDFGALRRAEKIQNQDRYYPIDARRSFYDSSYTFPPMQLAALVGSWADWQASGSVYEFRSASMGAAYWHPDAPNGGNGGPVWSQQHKEAIKRAVATYKDKLRPLIRNGDLYHIFPRPDGLHWDGVEYFDPAAKCGVVYIFKPSEENGDDTMQIKLRGIRTDAQYQVTFEDGSNPAVKKSGKELASGINVRLRGGLVSELMFFEEIAVGQ
jgi:Melibiase